MSDFDKQMAEIDKAMADLPEQAPPPAAPAPGKRVLPAAPPSAGRREVVSVWVRLVLVTLLAVGLLVWPYPYDCGLGLFGYLAAAGITMGTGLWTAVATWRLRLSVPHVLSLLVALSGAMLIAHQIALRIGYAASDKTWMCGG